MKVLLYLHLAVGGIWLAHGAGFQTGQAADLVLGQPDFGSHLLSPLPQANRFHSPAAVAFDPTSGKVFVTDTAYHRILRFSSVAASQNGSSAEAIFGQPSFTAIDPNEGGAPSAKSLNRPCDIFVDFSGRLWVADQNNNRILGFFLASSRATNSPADIVLGQPDFTSVSAGLAANRFSAPAAMLVDANDTLWVVDLGNRRILRFDAITTKVTGTSADGVLGQPDFTTNSPGLTASKIGGPIAAATDAAGNLWVAELANHRILRFDHAAAKANGAAADAVLGQPDFTTSTQPASPTSGNLLTPVGLDVDAAGDLWASDFGFNRLLRFHNPAQLPNNASADVAIGQSDLMSGGVGDGAGGFSGPMHIHPGAGGSLMVADFNHFRALRFSPVPDAASAPKIRVTGKKQRFSETSKLVLRGAATDAVRVEVKVGGAPYRAAIGSSKWRFTVRLRPGKNTVLVRGVAAATETSHPAKITIFRK